MTHLQLILFAFNYIYYIPLRAIPPRSISPTSTPLAALLCSLSSGHFTLHSDLFQAFFVVPSFLLFGPEHPLQ